MPAPERFPLCLRRYGNELVCAYAAAVSLRHRDKRDLRALGQGGGSRHERHKEGVGEQPPEGDPGAAMGHSRWPRADAFLIVQSFTPFLDTLGACALAEWQSASRAGANAALGASRR